MAAPWRLSIGGNAVSVLFQGLTARGLAWAVGIPRHLKVYPVDVKLIWPVAGRGRPRKRYIPDILVLPKKHLCLVARGMAGESL